MENAFGLLEEKVRKAAELVKRLRRENKSLADELGGVRGQLQEAEKHLAALEKEARSAPAKGSREREAAAEAELRALRQEREEVRRRIAGLLEILDGLE
jgi:chromosome segregation ATPase